MLKVYNVIFTECIYCEMIAKIKLINTCITHNYYYFHVT